MRKLPPVFLAVAVMHLMLPAPAEEPKKAGDSVRDSERAVKGAVDPELQKQIDQAIDKARAYLIGLCADKAKADPTALMGLFKWGSGEEALVGMALVQSGSPPQDPLVQRIWADLQALANGKLKDPTPLSDSYETYSLAVQLMFADAMMHAPAGKPWPAKGEKEGVLAWMGKLAERLAANSEAGVWTYTCKNTAAPKAYKVGGVGTLGLGTPELVAAAKPKSIIFDHSNTQYAVLGLKAALLCGVKPRTEVRWDLILQHVLSTQQKDGPKVDLQVSTQARRKLPGAKPARPGWEEVFTDGGTPDARSRGWNYTSSEGKPSIGMTAAGLATLLVARSEVGKMGKAEKKLVDEAIHNGVAWFQHTWSMPKSGFRAV